MYNYLSQHYINNELFQGLTNLLIIVLTLFITSVIVIGKEKKHEAERTHPWFGQYTMNIPNLMSYFRFPLGLWMVIVYYNPHFHTLFMYLTFHLSFALVCLFDILDGKFARRWHAITEDGKSLDPVADKWATFCLVAIAYSFASLRWWAIVIIFAREIISIIQRALLKRKGIDVSAKWLGKIKTVVQFTVLYIIILRSNAIPGSIFLEKVANFLPENLILWATILMCFCTVISLFPFFRSFSYVNNYVKTQKNESSKAWYIVAVPNIFTIGNYVCGVTAVYFAMPEVQVEHRPFVILFWVIAAAFFDAFDGPLSRKLKSFSDFGACLDSSTDLSTFGLAAAVVIFLRLSEIHGGSSILGIILALIYFTFVHLRLARFTMLADKQIDKSKKSDFVGLPSPAGAAGVLIVFTFFNNPIYLSISVIVLSFLMYSKLDFISHSNSIKQPIYKYFLIPTIVVGFLMLIVLIFQQPFVSSHFSKALIVYFRACSWILFIPLLIYVVDALRRTYLK
ncbi:MAG: CDP-diacylglycerol-serine O-phosphatidyltransferase [uncultured bacterium]|nr:MAG: CDP-diacylglycerol-serine O-phosphatidyltransferase [uncultured bacterium]